MNATDTLALLSGTSEWITGLAQSDFTQTEPPVISSSIGAHLRHIIDHYDAFAAPALEPGSNCPRIDYVSRPRDPNLEQSLPHAGAALDRITIALTTLTTSPDWADRPCRVCVATNPTEPDLDSTLGRELAFVTSHAVHHLALISMISRYFAIPFPENLGIAPSTQAYRKSQTLAH